MKEDDFLLIRMQTLNIKAQGKRTIATAAKHNKRTMQEHDGSEIDASRTHLNQSLLGLPDTPEGVISLAKQLIADTCVALPRVDTVVAIEVVVSLRRESEVSDLTEYCTDAALWVKERFCGTLLSADIHRDESSPHCHVIVLLPLVDGRFLGSSFIGGKRELDEHRKDFFDRVARKHGVRSPDKPLTGDEKRRGAKLVLECLREMADPILSSAVWPQAWAAINRLPDAFLRELGIAAPAKSFEAIATGRGAGPRTEAGEASRDRKLRNLALRQR